MISRWQQHGLSPQGMQPGLSAGSWYCAAQKAKAVEAKQVWQGLRTVKLMKQLYNRGCLTLRTVPYATRQQTVTFRTFKTALTFLEEALPAAACGAVLNTSIGAETVQRIAGGPESLYFSMTPVVAGNVTLLCDRAMPLTRPASPYRRESLVFVTKSS